MGYLLTRPTWLVILSVLWTGQVNSVWAESLQKLRGIAAGESKLELLIEATSHLNENEDSRRQFIEKAAEMFAKKGERILPPTGNPPIYPQGTIKAKQVRTEKELHRKWLVASVEVELDISLETTHRFLIETMSVSHYEGRKDSCSWTSMVGLTSTKKMGLGKSYMKPGRHEVLHILIARPMVGSLPAKVLDVSRSIVDVPTP